MYIIPRIGSRGFCRSEKPISCKLSILRYILFRFTVSHTLKMYYLLQCVKARCCIKLCQQSFIYYSRLHIQTDGEESYCQGSRTLS